MNDPGKIFLIPRSVLFAITILVATVIVDRARAEHANFKDEVFPIIQKFCVECHQPSGEGYEKRSRHENIRSHHEGDEMAPSINVTMPFR